jgi:hypothetical protein
MNHKLLCLVLGTLLSCLTACGGGGGAESSGGGGAGVAPPTGGLASVAPSTVLEGQLMKGPISLAEIKAYAVDASGNVSQTSIASTISDGSGKYSLKLTGGYSGPILVVATPSSQTKMKDEVSGSLVSLPTTFKLRSITIVSNSIGGGTQPQQLSITPFTELAYAVANGLGGGKLLDTNIRKALDLSKEQFGFDPASTVAIDSTITPSADASVESRRYAIALAAVSQLAQTNQAVTDVATKACLSRAGSDTGSRVACATTHIQEMLVPSSDGTAVNPSKSIGDFVSSVKRVDSNTIVNKTGITVADSPSVAKLTEVASQLSGGQVVSFKVTGVTGTTGIAAAKALMQNVRSNGDDIELSLNSTGISKSFEKFGKSVGFASTMTEDVSDLVGLVSEGVNLWIDHRNGRVLSPSGNFDQGGCTIYENKLPTNLGDYKFGNGLRGVPYISLLSTSANQKSAIAARQADPNFIIIPSIISTSAVKDSWIGCTLRSGGVTSLVDSVLSPGAEEVNRGTTYNQSLRLRVDSIDSALRPIQITYYGMTSKSFSQQYSATDLAVFTRNVNLLDVPVFGTIKLGWNGDTLSNLSINGDLPPSVNDSVVFDPNGYPISREAVEAARYSVRIDASLVKGKGTTRADLSNFQLGYVPVGQTASSITVDFLPTAQASFIEIPTQNNPTCIDINKTGLSLGLNITSSEGSASGNLKAASRCGTGSQVTENGLVELKGQVKLKNDVGNLLDLVEATIGLSVTNNIPTVKIEGVLGLPNRAPLNLVISATQERIATPTLTGITSANVGYKQGDYVMSFTGVQEENYFGDLVKSTASMSGSGGISLDWSKGQRILSLKENGKEIGTLNTSTKKLVFNDGTFEYLK